MYNSQQIGEAIKLHMKERGISNKELAANAENVSINTVSSIINGRNPSSAVVSSIATYLDVPVEVLLGSVQVVFWRRLSAYCKLHGISIPDMASDLGYKNSIVDCWKKGAQPSSKRICEIANHLGIESVDYLIGEFTPVLPSRTNENLAPVDICRSEIESDLSKLSYDGLVQLRKYMRFLISEQDHLSGETVRVLFIKCRPALGLRRSPSGTILPMGNINVNVQENMVSAQKKKL